MDNEHLEKLKEEQLQLQEEIAEFNKEKERIKTLIGGIGGQTYSKRDNIINIAFLFLILTFFILEVTTHWLPSNISIEVSILLVSIKIVWMIHSQHKYNHFIFWMLNSIEYRINETTKKLREIDKKVS